MYEYCVYSVTLAIMYSKTHEQTPKSRMPAVQMVNATFVLTSLLNVGRALSFLLIYIALTISK